MRMDGVDENLSTAERWYRKALERDHEFAQRMLYILADKFRKRKNARGSVTNLN